jgi:hypothetical protein
LQQLQRTAGDAPVMAPMPTDEISLVALAALIWRRRRAAWVTLSAIVACGLAVALLLPKTFAYTTTIEIGSWVDDGKTVPIESIDTTLNKLQEHYIPLARRRYQQDHPQDRHVFEVTARVPKGSQLVVLESKAPEAKSAPYRQIQAQAVQDLLADHGRVFELQRAAIGQQKQRAEAALQALVDEAAVIERQFDRLEQTDQLLEQQIADTRAMIDDASRNRTRAVGEARAMTLLMLDNEVRANRARLADLLQLQVGQAEKRDQLQKSLRENKRDQALQRAEIEQLDLQLKNLQETRALGVAMQSPRPVGASRSLIVALSLVLGCMLALLVPLVLEFVDRVQRTLHGVSARRADDVGAVTPAD